MYKVAMVARIELKPLALQHGLPFTKADMVVATAECSVCQHQTPTLILQYKTNSLQSSTSYPVSYWLYSWAVSIRERIVLCFFTRIGTYSGYGFTFPVYNAFAKTTNHGLTEYFINQHVLPHITSDQGTHFTTIKVWQWAPVHGIHWSYHVAHQSEAVGLIE